MPAVVASLQPAGRLPSAKRLELAIGLPLRHQAQLAQLLRQLYDPASPQFHQFLTPEQFAQRFGPSPEDYQALIAFAKASGLSVTRTYPNRALLDVSGRVADIETAFHLTLRVYGHPTEARTFYAPDAEPSLDLAIPVLTIGGLDNYIVPRPMNLKSASRRQRADGRSLAGSGPSGNYMGNDFRAAYVPGVSLTGLGQTVGLLEFDGYFAADIASYESQANLPSVSLTNVLVDSFNGAPGGNDDEVSLDIEMAISMAPGLTAVIVYETDITYGFGNDILNEMANPSQGEPLSSQLSSSWVFTTDASTDQIFQQFAAQGQSYFNASGDSDAYTGGIPTPAADTNITSVGGTTLTTSGPGGSWFSETVWNWGYDMGMDIGSGGGISDFAIPAWQQDVNMTTNQGSTAFRNIPDVALTADNIWVIYNDGASGEYGGTSCAAPLWAAFIALVNQHGASMGKPAVGFINPAIYALGQSASYANCFHDITTGNNTNANSPDLFYAVGGFDLCTGWGTPKGASLINALVSDLLQITPFTGFVSTGYVGGPFSITNQNFTLTNLSAASLNWVVANTSLWLKAWPDNGTLTPSGPATTVAISLKAAATNLPAGNYTNTVYFTNLQDGVVQSHQFTLQVQAPPEPLQITPLTGFAATGYEGGPFSVSNQSFTLTNLGSEALRWTLANTSSWLTVSPSSGVLPPGSAAATVTASLNAAAGNLQAGNYSIVLWFTNQYDGVVQSRQFTLAVISPELVQNGGFETGDFTGWTESGTAQAVAGMLVTTNADYVHSGQYGASLGSPDSMGYLSQSLPTSPGQLYLLSLWLASPDGRVPNEFLVSWDGNTLYDQTNLPAFGWTNMLFLVTATGAGDMLEFGCQDQPSFLGLDDVSVLPVPAPGLQSVALSGGTILFTWKALAGLSYQVQYKTNLLQPTWLNLGNPVTATNSTASASDACGPDRQRFYRVGLW